MTFQASIDWRAWFFGIAWSGEYTACYRFFRICIGPILLEWSN